MTTQQKLDHISRVRTAATALLDALNDYKTERRLYDSLDLGNVLVDGDFTGSHAGITKAQFVAAVGSLGTIDSYVATNNHDDVLYAIIE